MNNNDCVGCGSSTDDNCICGEPLEYACLECGCNNTNDGDFCPDCDDEIEY